jgi:hypothetical protein
MDEVYVLIEEHPGQTLLPTGVYTTYGVAVAAASKILGQRGPNVPITIHKDTVHLEGTEYQFKIKSYKVEE